MKRSRQSRQLLRVLIGLLLAGCHRAAESDEKETTQNAPESAVTFKGVRGLQVTTATLKTLGVVTAEAKERPIAYRAKLMVQIFEVGPPALATALVSPADAETLATRSPEGARLIRVDRAIEPATHQVELIFAVNEPSHAVGDFVEIALSSPARNALAVPRSAVIDGASGRFVYVVNGEYYLRTSVKTGVSDSDWTEITDGLYAGDVVATAGADKLWLAELRLTKGGADTD